MSGTGVAVAAAAAGALVAVAARTGSEEVRPGSDTKLKGKLGGLSKVGALLHLKKDAGDS